MARTADVHWHCVNRDCGWTAVMSFIEEDSAPLCVWGLPMKRSNMPQVLSYLDFLRGEESLPSAPKLNEE